MQFKEFKKQLSVCQPQELPSLFVFTGEHKLVGEFKEKGVQALALSVANDSKAADKADLSEYIDIKRFDAGGFAEAGFWNEVYAVPFLNKPKLVVLSIADKKGFFKDISESLVNYLQSKSFFTKLVILIDNLAECPAELRGLIGKKAYTVEFYAKSEEDLPDWIVDELRQQGKKIARADARLIVDKIGNNPSEIDAVLQKLILFHRDSPEISSESVMNFVDFEREYDIKELGNAIINKRPGQALRITNQLLKRGEPVMKILGYLRWFFGYIDKYRKDRDLISYRYEKLVESDWAIKTGLLPEDMALQILIIKLSRN